jgi:hypothetical protein
VSVHLAILVSEEKIFRKKNCLRRTCLVANRVNTSSLYRGPSRDASYQVLAHLAKQFQRRRSFLEINQSETRIACGGHNYLLMHRDEMNNLYREYSIDASYQFSVHLAKRFQRRCLKIGQSEAIISCGGHVC